MPSSTRAAAALSESAPTHLPSFAAGGGEALARDRSGLADPHGRPALQDSDSTGQGVKPNYALERSVKGSGERAAGAPEIIAPAARRPRRARPAQRGR